MVSIKLNAWQDKYCVLGGDCRYAASAMSVVKGRANASVVRGIHSD